MSDAPDPDLLTAPDDCRRQVLELAERFRRNSDQYRDAAYNEAQLRTEFLDPFFEALGWDVPNRAGYAEAYKDVVREASVQVEGQHRAPDYCFRIGGTPKFYVEAKKPSVNVKDAPAPAYQLRRYGWNAKLPLSILTDFEELAVYDCSKKPAPTDAPSVARVEYLNLEQYPDHLDKLYSLFSREAVLRGAFDRFAQDQRKHRGTQEVDADFLQAMEGWRESLAKDLARHNHGLSVRDLNFAVQATLDRILFLRIAEARGVEIEGRLLDTTTRSGIYGELCRLFSVADDKYNAGLFNFGPQGDSLCPGLTVSDAVLKPILTGLYYPKSPWEFSVFSADILGAVYEQFLGKVIRLTPAGLAKVEEKPEVKKAGGVYYTPTYIVDYIVAHTVGEALAEAGTPEAAAKLRILDPACGSGSFLLGAYDALLDWHLRYYLDHEPEKHARKRVPPVVQLGANDWRLTIGERKRILLAHIHGVDLDRQAVEVTKLNLLLKCLEGVTEQSADQLRLLHERLLPNLDANIKCGNSLIGSDYYTGRLALDEEEVARVNPFDWEVGFPEIMKSGGFDCVIGNPPYSTVTDEAYKQYFTSHFRTTEGRFDTFELFIEKGLNLCRRSGLFAYIVPSPLLSNMYSRNLRVHLLERYTIEEVINFGIDVFADPTIHTCIVVVRQEEPRNGRVRIRRQVNAPSELNGPYDYEVEQTALGTNPNRTFDVFFDPISRGVLQRIDGAGHPLGDAYFIRQCIKTGNDAEYVSKFDQPPGGDWRPSLRGRGMQRYSTTERDLYVKYGPWLARNWKNVTFYETPKIAIRETGSQVTATLDLDNRYLLSSLYSIYPRVNDDRPSLKYLLGLLNSALANYYLRAVALELTKGAFTKIRTNQLARLPIRTIDFSDPADVKRHDRMVALVERMLDLHRRLPQAQMPADRDLLQRQIDATDREIDAQVYELYGLTADEIAIVEGTA